MKKAEIIAMVESFLEPFAQEKQYEIVDVDFVKEGANWYLRVFADKEGGFSINDLSLIHIFLWQRGTGSS